MLAESAESCRMADVGMNIVVVVHQPRYSVFTLFHEVLFLGKQGRTVFLGPANAAVPYFTSLGFELPPNENPADFCLDIISGAVPCRGRPDFRVEVSGSKPSSFPRSKALFPAAAGSGGMRESPHSYPASDWATCDSCQVKTGQ